MRCMSWPETKGKPPNWGKVPIFAAIDLARDREASFLAEIHAKTGPIATLVNNAGVHLKKPVWNVSHGELDSVLSLNVSAMWEAPRTWGSKRRWHCEAPPVTLLHDGCPYSIRDRIESIAYLVHEIGCALHGMPRRSLQGRSAPLTGQGRICALTRAHPRSLRRRPTEARQCAQPRHRRHHVLEHDLHGQSGPSWKDRSLRSDQVGQLARLPRLIIFPEPPGNPKSANSCGTPRTFMPIGPMFERL